MKCDEAIDFNVTFMEIVCYGGPTIEKLYDCDIWLEDGLLFAINNGDEDFNKEVWQIIDHGGKVSYEY